MSLAIKGLSVVMMIGASLLVAAEEPCQGVLGYSELISLEQPEWGKRIAYGDSPLQFGELRVPPGEGPFPVVIVIHGGCWQSAYDMAHIRPLAAALEKDGFAVWTPEYRRVGDDGGGWPGTFVDLGAAADHLNTLASLHPLDLERVVALGHSAGGHLALWLGSRRLLPTDHPLKSDSEPLKVTGVVSLAGIPDLKQAAELGVCGTAALELVRGARRDSGEPLALGSPIGYLPLGIRQHVINGRCDGIGPPRVAATYAERAAAAGDEVELVLVNEVGHFELVSPVSTSWPAVIGSVRALGARRDR